MWFSKKLENLMESFSSKSNAFILLKSIFEKIGGWEYPGGSRVSCSNSTWNSNA